MELAADKGLVFPEIKDNEIYQISGSLILKERVMTHFMA